MSKKAFYLLGIIAAILVGTWLQVVFCCNCYTTDSKTVGVKTISNVKEGEITNFVKGNGFSFSTPNLRYNCNDNFNFIKSSYTFLLPVSDSINLGISKLKVELKKTDSNFKIIGLYASNEVNNSIFPNLGLARANTIKNYLVKNGISEKSIEISDALRDELIVKMDTLFGAVSFEWVKNDPNIKGTKDWKAIKNRINASPLILYFNTGQASILLSQAEKQKIADVVDYINHVDGAKISIIGHSDNNPGVRHTNQFIQKNEQNLQKNTLLRMEFLKLKLKVLEKQKPNLLQVIVQKKVDQKIDELKLL